MTPLTLSLTAEAYAADVELLRASFLPEELVLEGPESLPEIIALTLLPEAQDPVLLVLERTANQQTSAHRVQLRVTSQHKTLSAEHQAALTDSCSSLLASSEENPLFNIAMHLRERVQELGLAAATTDPDPEAQSQSQLSKRALRVKRVLLWSHHLLAISKRKDIVSWSSDLSLAGLSKPGYPGVIIVEGEDSDADEFVRRIKALQWQALQVRCEESEEVQDVRKAMRLHLESDLKPVVHEVESLAEISSRMSAAGLDSMFASALKLPGRA